MAAVLAAAMAAGAAGQDAGGGPDPGTVREGQSPTEGPAETSDGPSTDQPAEPIGGGSAEEAGPTLEERALTLRVAAAEAETAMQRKLAEARLHSAQASAAMVEVTAGLQPAAQRAAEALEAFCSGEGAKARACQGR